MPNPDPETKVPFEDEAPEQGHVTEDRERVPGQPPVREGAPLVDPDRAPGVPDPGVPPGPGSPA
jgi:hypothetical protein